MGISTTPSMVAKLVKTTYDHFLTAESALSKFDWAAYGSEMKAVRLGLEKLLELMKQWQEGPIIPQIRTK